MIEGGIKYSLFLCERRKIMGLIKKINKPKILIYDEDNEDYDWD